MIRSIVALMRPGDWVKNVFVLLAPVFAVPTMFAEDATGTPARIEVGHADPPDLLVNLLSELLYRSEAEDVAFVRFGLLGRDGASR